MVLTRPALLYLCFVKLGAQLGFLLLRQVGKAAIHLFHFYPKLSVTNA